MQIGTLVCRILLSNPVIGFIDVPFELICDYSEFWCSVRIYGDERIRGDTPGIFIGIR